VGTDRFVFGRLKREAAAEEEATEEAEGKMPSTRAGETPTPQQKKPLRRS
jgi:hypothetical protein